MATDIVVVAVLRAGLSLVDSVLDLLPNARVGHVGLKRDEATAVATKYSSHLPPSLADSVVLLVDPMLATGGSAIMAVDVLKAAGATRVRLLCVVAAPEGVAALAAAHPDVDVYTAALDRELNAKNTSCRAWATSAIASTARSDLHAFCVKGIQCVWRRGNAPRCV